MAIPIGPPGSFAAPEGVYSAAAITLPLAELPVSGSVPSATTSAPAVSTISSSHDSAPGTALTQAGAGAMSANPSSSGSPATTMNNATGGCSGSAATGISSAFASLPPSNVLPVNVLPLSWRRELGCTVQPSLSSCSIRWGAGGSSSSDFTGAIIAGVGVVGGRKNRDRSDTATMSGGDAPGTTNNAPAVRRIRKGANLVNGNNKGSASSSLPTYSGPNPLIEGVMVAQGIDAPASSTMGGLGGMVGMTALTSYGFLPNGGSGRDPFDLTAPFEVGSDSSSSVLNPTAPFRPPKNPPKPKNNVKQSNSSFVVRSWVHPDLKDILSSLEKAYTTYGGGQGEDDNEVDGSRGFCDQPPFYVTQRGRTLMWFVPHLPSSSNGPSSASASEQQAQQSVQPTVLLRILFASPPSSHDINQLTRSPTTLDVVVGFPTGDLLWLDLMSMRYSRFNKGGCCTDSGVTKVRWLPSTSQSTGSSSAVPGTGGGSTAAGPGAASTGGGEGLFVSAHVDGSMLVWDREREDAEAGKGWSPRTYTLKGGPTPRRPSAGPVMEWDPKRSIIVSRPGLALLPNGSHQIGAGQAGSDRSADSVNGVSSTGLQTVSEGFSSSEITTKTSNHAPNSSSLLSFGANVLSPKKDDTALAVSEEDEHGGAKGTQPGSKWDKNPVTHWRVSRSKINDFAISPDLGCIAVVSEDSLLRIIDLTTETLIASHSSYFGSFLSLSFSTDGKYLLTTSCDDLVSLYQPRPSIMPGISQPSPSRLLARCVGHSSWVRGVAFDPYRWREGDRTYRFGSVGEDGKICLWDFAGGRSLGRIKTTAGGGGISTIPGSRRPTSSHPAPQRRRGQEEPHAPHQNHQHLDAGVEVEDVDDPLDVYHPAPSRSTIPTLRPISTHHISSFLPTSLSPLISIRFSPRSLLVLHENGVTTSWERPRGKRPLVAQQLADEEEEAEERRRRGMARTQKFLLRNGNSLVSAGGVGAASKSAAGLLSKGWGSMRGGITRTMSGGPGSGSGSGAAAAVGGGTAVQSPSGGHTQQASAATTISSGLG